MKKGFTLVELLGVIVILGIISIIVVPSIVGLINRTKVNIFEDRLKDIAKAAEIYMADRNNGIPETGISLLSNTIVFKNSNKIVSGTVKYVNNLIYLENVSDGKFCGSGYSDNFSVIEDECEVFTTCYNFDSSTGTITNYDKENTICSLDVVIPSQINGVNVTSIGVNAFNSIGKIKSISLPYGIISIGNNAFLNNAIENIDLSNLNSIDTIGDSAFEGNPIDSVIFSTNPTLTHVGQNAFCPSEGHSAIFTNEPIILNGVTICIH